MQSLHTFARRTKNSGIVINQSVCEQNIRTEARRECFSFSDGARERNVNIIID